MNTNKARLTLALLLVLAAAVLGSGLKAAAQDSDTNTVAATPADQARAGNATDAAPTEPLGAAIDVSGVSPTEAAKPAVDRAILFRGDTLSRFDRFGADGNQAGQVFGNLGPQWYQDLSFSLEQQRSPFHRWFLDVSAVHNNSLYRSPRWGSELERLRFQQERGDVPLPYRLELGDIYANLSYRTMQRSLRGGQIDLQPKPRGNERHSFLFLYGVADYDWNEVEQPNDRNAGFSWLYQKGEATKLGFHAAYNLREGDATRNTLERDQRVFGLGLERTSQLGGAPVLFEAEWARFSGDHDGRAGLPNGQDRDDGAIFAQISGGKRPFTYRLRYEANGQDFRPVAANVAPDRRSHEAYTSWELGRGRYLTARYQNYRNNWESINPLDSKTFGIGLRGPIDDKYRWQGGIDAFIETSVDDSRRTDQKVRSLVGDLNHTFNQSLSGRLALSYRTLDDNLNDLSDNRVTQLALGLDHSTRMFDWNGRLGLDLENRLIDSGGERSREFTPALALSMSRDRQNLSMHYRFQRQDHINPIRLDVDTAGAGLRYQIQDDADTFGVEYLQNRREDSAGIWSRSWQVALFWRHEFDTVWQTARRPVATPAPAQRGTASAEESASDAPGTAMPAMETAGAGQVLTGFVPGAAFAKALARLEEMAGGPARRFGELAMADVKLFTDIPQRQRLVLERTGETLNRAVAVLDVDGSIPGQVGDVLERTRRTLIEWYGAPTEVYDRGTFGPRLAEAVRGGVFARTAQWVLPGGMLRLGLPRRLDGRLRVEIHWAASLGRVRDPLWGLETLD